MAADEHKLDGERRKALTLAISQIEKQLGKGSIMRMGAESPRGEDRRRSPPAPSTSMRPSASAASPGAGSPRSMVRSRPARRR